MNILCRPMFLTGAVYECRVQVFIQLKIARPGCTVHPQNIKQAIP
jgi:hypothetical protein